MGKIEQYRPAFFSGFETEEDSFKTLEQLLNIPWVKSFSDYPDFLKYSAYKREGGGYMLVAEYDGGNYGVGYVDENNIIKKLPKSTLRSSEKKINIIVPQVSVKKEDKTKRCKNCIFYEEKTLSSGSCNRKIREIIHYKTGNAETDTVISVRSTWLCNMYCYSVLDIIQSKKADSYAGL